MFWYSRNSLNSLFNQIIDYFIWQIYKSPSLLLISIKGHDKAPILSKRRNCSCIGNSMIKYCGQSVHYCTEAPSFFVFLLMILVTLLRKGMRMWNRIGATCLSYKHTIRSIQYLTSTLIKLLCIQCNPWSSFDGVRNVHDDNIKLLLCFHKVLMSISNNKFHFRMICHCLSTPFWHVLLANFYYFRIDIYHHNTFDR